jgi:hypothetical protein
MAKDDYFVLVYKILSYLYDLLKKGIMPDPKMLCHDSPLFNININENYWTYIMDNLQKQGLISGLIITNIWGGGKIISDLGNCQITPNGITYLSENNSLKKVKG